MHEDDVLVERIRRFEDAEAAKMLVGRYEKAVFGFVLNLTGCNKDLAYEVASASLCETLHAVHTQRIKKLFLLATLERAILQSRSVRAVPSVDAVDFMHFSPEKRESLKLIKEALLGISFEYRVVVLLRDQQQLLLDEIASVLDVPARQARFLLTEARIRLRDWIEKTLKERLGGAGS